MQNCTKSYMLNLLIREIGNLKKFGENMQNHTKSHMLNLLIGKIENFKKLMKICKIALNLIC